MLSRWQFALTTLYHYIFVPITLGLVYLVAILQTVWFRKGNTQYLRLTKFFGKLFLINFAVGVATGIVQEFQFGMNWSDYSRFVGDIFGAPLAFEGLMAFFLESTFIGLWIFGWDKLPKKIHLACIWLTAVGTSISAFWILAANSWMQHPVGYEYNPVTGRAELKSFVKFMTNSTALATFGHTMTAAFLVAAMLMVSVSAWHLVRNREPEMFRRSMRIGLTVGVVAAFFVALFGHTQAQLMTEQQPMKMAAAEAPVEHRKEGRILHIRRR